MIKIKIFNKSLQKNFHKKADFYKNKILKINFMKWKKIIRSMQDKFKVNFKNNLIRYFVAKIYVLMKI